MAEHKSQVPTAFAAIDWPGWRADEVATLVFCVRADRVLLIRKKRGLGAGKITAPGGRREPGESLNACASRELAEEVGLTLLDAPQAVGMLRFQFTSGYRLQVHLFRSLNFGGVEFETDEAIPCWHRLDALPLSEMWEDDGLWLPQVLEGLPMCGDFLFAGERMLGHRVWQELAVSPSSQGEHHDAQRFDAPQTRGLC